MSTIFKFWPVKKFFSYIFKQVLGNYLNNDLDFDKINFQVSDELHFVFNDLELNCQKINELHLASTNFKLIDGRISSLSVRIDYSNTKQHEIKIDNVSLLIFPVETEQKNFSSIDESQKKNETDSENSVLF